MAEGYLHVQIAEAQLSKNHGKPCGDFQEVLRSKTSTIQILCDGLGSGVTANLAAVMCASRIKQLLKSGFTVRETFEKMFKTMEHAKKNNLPYSVFSIVRILNDGVTSIFSYEMPPPIFVSRNYSTILNQKKRDINGAVLYESNCILKNGEGILVVSDGITYSGIGTILSDGWGIEGLNKFITNTLSEGIRNPLLPKLILDEAEKNWGYKLGDDCTVVFARCCLGNIVNIITGPPVDPNTDKKIVSQFMNLKGLKVVCGASTAKMVAREIGEELEMSSKYESNIAPPNYDINGLDLVTEGAVTLNQLYNIWDEDNSKFERKSPVTELYNLISSSDKINFYVGNAFNEANEDISFKQTGILSRNKIIPLLKQLFEEDGKLVEVVYN
ncbi:MAG: SpoIIE family protein phosphatase [Ignavibacteriae bacterium]|nr:hypothetical protein [Ignavibacteriota bacterium]NOG96356.1 SpoIIE family protein phosphatase [Ignavibacteriota bacterium]